MNPLPDWQSHFDAHFGKAAGPVQQFFAPGRANLIGEHIDYNGGPVMPIAISKGITAWVRPNSRQKIRARSMQTEGVLEIDPASPDLSQRSTQWMNYPLGVFAQLHGAGFSPDGADILLHSDLPAGAGLSSSAALELLFAFVLQHKREGAPFAPPLQMALMCQRAEHEFIGVKCGIMDQFAVANGKKGHAMLLNCESLACEQLPFDTGGYSLVVVNSNKSRQLSESKYNERKAECDAALEMLQKQYGLPNLCSANPEQLGSLKDPTLKKRARHAITEAARVLAAADLLKAGEIKAAGQLLNASHLSLRDDYEVTGFHLDTLWEHARNHDACIGTRMTGAGFGGCIIALVETGKMNDFEDAVGKAYLDATGLPPDFFTVEAVDGVGIL